MTARYDLELAERCYVEALAIVAKYLPKSEHTVLPSQQAAATLAVAIMDRDAGSSPVADAIRDLGDVLKPEKID